MSQLCPQGYLHFLSSPESLKSICHIITYIEIPFHIFGVYCIVVKTPERMRNVKWSMLIMHFSITCLNLIMSFLLIPFMMVPALAGAPMGLLADLGVPLAFQMYLALTGPADQNFGRWDLKKNSPCIFKFSSIPLESVFIFTQDLVINTVPMIFVIFLVIVQATVVIPLIYYHCYEERFKMSENTTQMQKRFMKALFGQFLLFVTILGVPVSVFTFSMFLDDYNQGLNNLCIIILSLNGLISTTALIILHPPYREWILGCFQKKSRRCSVVPVS